MPLSRSVLGANVRRLRVERGLSQRELGEAVGRGQSWASDLERGVHESLKVDLLNGIAKALGVRVERLLKKTRAPSVSDRA